MCAESHEIKWDCQGVMPHVIMVDSGGGMEGFGEKQVSFPGPEVKRVLHHGPCGDIRFYTSAGNPVKEILLKLNLPDHRKLKDGGEVKEFQRRFHHSDTERLSRSDEVLKLKNFKKDVTLKLFKSTNQERYEHVFSIWKAIGENTRDLGSFGEETDKTTDLHQHLSRISTQKLETASQITRDVFTTNTKSALQVLNTASECMTRPII
ncbi:hypothetical protein Tco_1215505 [Tanacetum coccineum]